MTLGKKITAYILNFIIVGSGFVIIKGYRGFSLGLIYLVPFVVVNVFRKEIGTIWPIVIMAASYAHLTYILRKEGKDNKEIFAINTATKLLKVQMQLGSSNDQKSFSKRLSDKFALGYMFGFNDAILQLAGIRHEDSLAAMNSIYSNLFDDLGAAILTLEESLKYQNEDAFRKGMFAGGNDLHKFFSDETPPLGLADFLLGEKT